MKQMFKVISHSEAVTIQKQDGTTIIKSTLVLQELGGKYEDSYACTLINSQVRYYPNDVVYAALRFTHREYNGNNYQEVVVQEIYKVTI